MRLLARYPAPRRRGAALFAFVLLLLAASAAGAEETRIALVIGNGAYRDQPLSNPTNDARLIAATLKRLGFAVKGGKPGEPLLDADQKAMKQAIRGFGEQLERAGAEAIGLFFYAGHAVQAGGKNYLIPVGAAIDREGDLEIEALSADSVLTQMTYARTRVNLVILDACRNNPYRGRFRAATRGLAEMSAPRGSLIAYSTAPGEVAEDGAGGNSPYSAALAEAVVQADVPVELIFKRVRGAVMQASGGRQVPWESSSLIGDFFFLRTLFDAPLAWPPATPPLVVPPEGLSAAIETATQPPAASPGVVAAVGIPPALRLVGKLFRDCAECPEMVVVPEGLFQMGSPDSDKDADADEKPQHLVTLAKPFAIGKYEVTFAEWDVCVQSGGCNRYRPDDRGWGRDQWPVINVSWADAQAYAAWLSQKTGKPYRLPSEAEWEYAARAGAKTRYTVGDQITARDANFYGMLAKAVKVGSYAPNVWGLHDVQGNVSEWVEDCYHNSYWRAPADGRPWVEDKCTSHVVRGGDWLIGPSNLRSAYRNYGEPRYRDSSFGFRVARTLD
ncbi:MAG: SUMF1/EgtB/PvdO family nonheme iron enzyme [Defluviicoccus sp.]|nr:SUMF1/EgtB/PvdO family nonheme iron enzyme [Defluviicoccus sp.]MDG4607744.1 SUMF1/EgtB/PvdO family nonheme iron enzyme [Defluviicoccus sp.]